VGFFICVLNLCFVSLYLTLNIKIMKSLQRRIKRGHAVQFFSDFIKNADGTPKLISLKTRTKRGKWVFS